ncbi:MAG: HPF/RaiA family ribosome-associated protein [Ferruginibacter sp.]
MNYTENFEGIKMDIQTVDLTISEELQDDIRQMIKRLKRHISEINWVDAYFKMESKRSTDVRMLSVRLGIPGQDVFASENGYYWQALLKNVEIKLRRQLRRKPALR